MHDPRIDQLARQLIRYSTAVRKGDRVMLDLYDAPNSIALALIREVVKAKAVPVVKLHDTIVTRELMKHADPEGYAMLAKNNLDLMKEMDCYIAVRGSHNITETSDVPADKMKLVMEKMRPVINHRVNNTRWCVLRWPTPAMAQQAGMSTEAFEDFYFRVCLLDYKSLLPAMNALKKLMDKTNKVHIKGPGTDLRFSLKGLKAIACGGAHNIPDGEVFTAPVKDSVEGHITYNTPIDLPGHRLRQRPARVQPRARSSRPPPTTPRPSTRSSTPTRAPATSASSPSASTARSASRCATSSSTRRSPAPSTSPPARPTKASPTTATAARSTGTWSASSAPTTAAARSGSTASSSARTASSSRANCRS